jgi:hypothetical protein
MEMVIYIWVLTLIVGSLDDVLGIDGHKIITGRSIEKTVSGGAYSDSPLGRKPRCTIVPTVFHPVAAPG